MNDYSYDNLKRILETERGRKLVAQIKEGYSELFEGKPIERPSYADFMHIFDEGGDTRTCDLIDTKRKLRFFCLQILSLVDDKYISDLEEMIDEFCSQYTWFSSYHGRDNNNQSFNYNQIDLDTAFMSALLSTTYWIMYDKLRYDIKVRIRREIERRLIIPFENNPTYFGFGGGERSNWVATQTYGTGLAYLYVFPERLELVKDRLFNSLDAYFSGISDDGYCTEGHGYWAAGFNSVSSFLDSYVDKTKEDITNITKSEKILKSVAFGHSSILKYGYGIPFSDHQDTVEQKITKSVGHTLIKRVFGAAYKMYSAYDESDLFTRDENGNLVTNAIVRGENGYHRILSIDTFEEDKEGGIVENSTYIYPIGGAYIANRDKYSFAAKAGNNAECHNHNDIGNFALYVNGKRIFHDVRSHKYDAIYFDEKYRYTDEVFAASSFGHSVPIIDGKRQTQGAKFAGEIVESSDDIFEVNISGAYDLDISTLKVRYELSDDQITVKYFINEPTSHSLKLRFITVEEPSIGADGMVDICGVSFRSVQNLPLEMKKVEYLAHHVEGIAYTLEFDAGSVQNGEFEFEIKI
ncbi:MAG: hypothetical protein E7626_03395 [Ruminococcaceae bacterium]|nr:hypothetical protein [Oscillospiraceae bacterium]